MSEQLCDCCERPLGNATHACPHCGAEFATPVVAEVRRAPIHGLFDSERPSDDEVTTIRWGRLRELFDAESAVVLQLEPLRAEVARLTAERDDLREQGGQLNCQLDVLRVEYEALRTRLRGLIEQWQEARSASGYYAQAKEDCADELARLLTTPEEPGT